MLFYQVNELIGDIFIRYNREIYENYHGPFNQSSYKVFNIMTLNTLNLGKCYTVEFPERIHFYALDNVILTFKTKVLLFLHGIGQNVGIIGQFYPAEAEPTVYTLEPGFNYQANFEGENS